MSFSLIIRNFNLKSIYTRYSFGKDDYETIYSGNYLQELISY